ncbi:hypothetical protein OESDEN_23773, partial [Oesophagostomum dentatum]
MVALQWLVANEEAFSPTYIGTNVLERLIKTSARRVTIGQSGMMFEAGPWHCFGSEILKKLVQGAATLSRTTSIVDTSDLSSRRPDLMFNPDYSVVVKEDCTYLDITVAAYINAYKSTLMQREK